MEDPPIMQPAPILAPPSPRPSRLKSVFYVIIGLCWLVLTALVYNYIWPHAPAWATINAPRIIVRQVIAKPLDHISDWPSNFANTNTLYGDGGFTGAAGHWLANASPPDSDTALEYVWYDGHVVASGSFIVDGSALSDDGLHYAFTERLLSQENNTSDPETLVVDDKSVITGDNFSILHVGETIDTTYYTCTKCNGSNGLFKGLQNITKWGSNNNSGAIEGLTQNGVCLYKPGADQLALLRRAAAAVQHGADTVGCSPNGAHIITNTSHSNGIGTSSSLAVDGHAIGDSDNAGVAYVDNQGKASFLESNYQGQGFLIIHGKRYRFPGYTIGDIQASPSQNHIIIALGSTANDNTGSWWLDGRDTNFPGNDIVSLNDSSFYAYTYTQ